MAFGQSAAAAISAPQIEKQDSAELKIGAAQVFDGLKVKPGSGRDAVPADASDQGAAGTKWYLIIKRGKAFAMLVRSGVQQPIGFYRPEAQEPVAGEKKGHRHIGFNPSESGQRGVRRVLGFSPEKAQRRAARAKHVDRPIGFYQPEVKEPEVKAEIVQQPIGFCTPAAKKMRVRRVPGFSPAKAPRRTDKRVIVERPIGFSRT
jgi:hypothetical protein